jgi:class 3 adenylate cyclase/tetratricopeptide (TPR) repeat protein
MLCPSCGTENPADNKFCLECGSPLARACPTCGKPVLAGAKFCGECGGPLDAAAPVKPARTQPEAERRLVTVLFADLVGFTTLSESRDAEEVRELLSRYFDICRRLIELYGGTVEKFIGDAVMAVWGTPTATEDDAERAVRAALDLVTAVSALGQELGAEELRARAGVLTGEAAVTIGAEGQGMVAGDLVNTASRVQSVAEPGSVYVGDTTRRATEQTIVFEEAGSFELKGKAGLTPLWKALRVVSGIRGSLKSEGLEAPFVGRERELRQIKDFFHASADERKAHLISVTGIAGIGKSRLAWEFFKYIDGLQQIIWWHRGRCLAYGEGVTYWALADMVRMRCRIAEDEDADSALEKLQATLSEHLLDPDERRFVEPRLAQLLGLGDSEGRDRQDLFAAWRLFFERLADVYPTVLVFEDMQWADASLLDFVEYLLEWSRNHPLLVVTLARPDLLERRPTWGAGHRNFTSMYLEPLSQESMEELLAGLVPGLPDAMRAQILERAEGVPLYAMETVRMLLDRGLLAQEGSVYRPVGEIESLEVPETLHALIAARLDGLSEDERRLLQDGAVLGKTFTRQALAALGGRPEAELEPLLTSLVRKEVLSRQADPRSPEHGQYGFLQDLVRRVAYETLSKRDRRARHLAAAEHVAANLGEDEVAEVVASHLLEAYNAGPEEPDAEEIKAKAGEALVRAAERAESLGAVSEAQRYFEQAAGLTDDSLVHAELADRAGEMAWLAGKPVEARALLEQAHEVFEGRGDARAAARASRTLAQIDFREGHPQQAVARLEPALEALGGGEPDADLAALAAQLSRFLVLSGDNERAAPYIELALTLAETLDQSEALVEALTNRGILLVRTDRLYEARAVLEAAVDLAESRDLHHAALRAYNNLAVVLENSEQEADALAICDRALPLARRVGNRVWEESFVGGQISILFLLGRWDEALARIAEAEELRLTTAASESQLLPAVAIHAERGAFDEARELLARLDAVAQSEEIQSVAGSAMAEAHLFRMEGRPREALAAAERALGFRRELGATALPTKLALVQALEAAVALGDVAKTDTLLRIFDELRPGQLTPFLKAHRARFHARLARGDIEAQFATAERLFRDAEMPFYLAITELEHGEWLAGQGRADEAEPLLGEARETFERLRARPWLERLAQVAPVLSESA